MFKCKIIGVGFKREDHLERHTKSLERKAICLLGALDATLPFHAATISKSPVAANTAVRDAVVAA